jgi:PAS domain S-box-containing protein
VVIVPLFLVSAAQLLRVPPVRRGLGTRITGGVFLLQGLLWLVYAFAFLLVWQHSGDTAYSNPFAALIRVNPFIDTLVEMLLAFGMIAMLNEQARHEADEERAARLRDLAESGERLAAVIRGANDAIVMLDAEGRVVLSNAAADQMFSAPGSPLPGRLLAGCITEAERPGFGAWLAGRSGGEPGARTLLGLRPDGTPFSMEASAADVSLGGVSHRLLVIRDITARERAESERLELQRRLAQFEKTEALGRLVSGITHELNNPLAAILAAIGDLLEDAPPEREHKALSAIQEQAQRCRLITRNLPLAFHAQAELAAQAALCANAQGKYWPMREQLFTNSAASVYLMPLPCAHFSSSTILGTTIAVRNLRRSPTIRANSSIATTRWRR